MNWVKRINSVLEYIENNLDGEIDDIKIAVLFASPQGMFQRIFANITNMTLSEYIRKRRLSQAAYDITHTNEKVIDISIKYGYSSATAFSSAFKRFHGITPSEARKSGIQPKSFQRFAFTLILSEKGVDSVQYCNLENAEYLLQQMVRKKDGPWSQERLWLRNVSEHNGVKCACDGPRAGVILPEGADDWDLSDAYFDTGNVEEPRFSLDQVFKRRSDSGLSFELSKEQVAILLVSLDGAKTDFKRKFMSLTTEQNSDTQEVIVCVDVSTLGIITEEAALQLKRKSGVPLMNFNVTLIEESLKFIMCSAEPNIELHYSGYLRPLIMKSGRLYAAVSPFRK